MKIEEVLAANLDALMSARPDLNSQQSLGKASGVGQTTVGRMRRGEGAARIDAVAQVARVFNLRACDLLDPTLISRLKAGASSLAQHRLARLARAIEVAELDVDQITILENTAAAMRIKAADSTPRSGTSG